jgi:CelD/BcsL family acetyltransferase involved in cellulose biosynthesis
MELLLEASAALAVEVDRVDLEPWRWSSVEPVAELLREHDFAARELEPAPELALPPCCEEPEQPLRGRLAKLAYYRRRAERLGPYRVTDERALPATLLLEQLIRLHAARWRQRDEPGVLADPVVQAFHRVALPRLAAAGLTRMTGLAIGQEIVAVVYGLGHRGRLYLYLAGWDPEPGHPGLGALAVGEAIEAARQRGDRAVDFLRGRESYKYSWGARDQRLAALRSPGGPVTPEGPRACGTGT